MLTVAMPVDAGMSPNGWPLPVVIHGDGEFTAANWVAGGNGTADDPYIITGWPNHTYVEVRGTTAHFVIRDVAVARSGQYTGGIHLYEVRNARVENVSVGYGDIAVRVWNSNGVTIDGVRPLGGAGQPVVVEYSSEVVVENCNLTGRDGQMWGGSYYGKAAVDARGGSAVVVRNNTLAGGKAAGVSVTSVDGAVVANNTVRVEFGRPAVEVLGGAGAVVEGNTVVHAYDRYGTAVRIAYTEGALVSDHRLNGGETGIMVDGARNSTIRGNMLEGYRYFGVHIVESQNTSLLGNSFGPEDHSSYHWRAAGVTLRGSTHVSMRQNTFVESGLQFDRWGTLDAYASHDITPDNLVNGDPLVYRARCGTESVTAPAGQVIAAGCAHVTVSNASFGPSPTAIMMYKVARATIEDVVANGTYYGIEYLEGDILEVRRTAVNGSNDAIIANARVSARLDGVTVTDSRNGLWTGGDGGVAAEGSVFRHNRKAISSMGPGGFTLLNSTVAENDLGFYTEGPGRGLVLSGNNFSSNRIGAFASVRPGHSLAVAGNAFASNVMALTVEDSPGAVVEGNVVAASREAGITVTNSSGAIVRANRVMDTTGPGLSIQATWGAVVEENNLTNDGISVGGTVDQLASHRVAANNTVNGLPVAHRANCTDLELDGAAVGQVIVVNCAFVRLANLTIDRTDTAVAVFGGSKVVVENSRFRANDGPGVAMAGVVGGQVRGSVVEGSVGSGLTFSGDGVAVSGNRVSGATGAGILLAGVSDAAVRGNELTSNHDGIACTECHGVTIEDNEVRGSNGPTIQYANPCGRIDMDSDGQSDDPPVVLCPAIYLPPTYAGHAVRVAYSTGVQVLGNVLEGNNGTGVHIAPEGARIRYPGTAGQDVVVAGNRIAWNNGTGVYVDDFRRVRVFHNQFLNNSIQADASIEASVAWDNGYPSGGNFWSDHVAEDVYAGPEQDEPTGPDGILDEPYMRVLVNDRYPLARAPAPGTHPRVNVTPPTDPPASPPSPPGGPSLETEKVAIRAHVTDPEGLVSVSACYRYTEHEEFTCVEMARVGADEYEVWVRAPRAGEALEYYIDAVDRLGEATRTPEEGAVRLDGGRPPEPPTEVSVPGFGLLAAAAAFGVAAAAVRRRP